MSHFANKVVVITGGTDGIGKALVDLFLLEGARVATCGRNHDKLYQIQRLYPNNSLYAVWADVSKESDCKGFIEAVIQTFGTIDILINNAGISMRAMFNEADLDTIRQLMDVNFWGSVYCTKYALPYIIKNKGTVTGISSVAGFRGLPGRTGYSASKFALNGFLEALRTEVLDDGVNIMWVCPGFTSTNIRNVALNAKAKPQAESLMDESKMMTPKECGEHIINAIKKRERTLVLTAIGKRTLFMSKYFPALADKMIRKFYFKKGKLIR